MEYVPLAPLLAVLGTMLALSLVVERFLTIFSWIVDRFWVTRVSSIWTGIDDLEAQQRLHERAHAEALVLDGLPQEEVVDPHERDPREIEPFPDPSSAPAVEARFRLKGVTRPNEMPILKEFYLQILSAITAIFICMNAGFSAFQLLGWTPGEGLTVTPPAFWEYLLTGIIIGAGSKPIHFLIEFLVNRKVRVTRDEVEREATAETAEEDEEEPVDRKAVNDRRTAPAVVTAPASLESYVGFSYSGGDRPERLEHTHLRKPPVNLIVYHHTAMHSDASFAALVQEFDRKNWLTGYHCVTFTDGAVRSLCRWDRTGNHARGCNFRSLGVAFQGNFETDPAVPFANADGRLGMQHPTQEQLEAAARVTALWVHLYEIPLRFPADDTGSLSASEIATNVKDAVGIVPHNFIAAKACPGSNFPHELFQSLVRDYHERWNEDESFREALSRFEKKPMVTIA